MAKALDLAGMRFGRLTVLARVENDAHGKTQWVCRCDCGGAHIARVDNLKAGRVTRCPTCERERTAPLRIDAWYYSVMLGYDVTGKPGFVDGVAGFGVVSRDGVELMASPWAVGRIANRQPMPVINGVVCEMARRGLIRCVQSPAAASSWAYRNRALFVHHSFMDGDRVWTEWYGRTSEWRGPVDEIAHVAFGEPASVPEVE